jgi:Cd2+/Zn2+-exporting ATPase
MVAEEEKSSGCQSCDHDHGHATFNLKVALFGGILILNSFLARWFFFEEEPFAETLCAVAGAVILAIPILTAAVKDLSKGKAYMNELVALALIAAFVMKAYQEAGIIAFFMLIAISLEEKTAIGAKTAIESLIRLTPTVARRLGPNGEESEIAVRDLKVGDTVRVRPGENFPADGKITKGNSAVNQAPVTGESLPIDKSENDAVYAGTENLSSMVEVEVTGVGSDTTLGQVRELIEKAERSRLPIMRMVDQYVVYYTPTILMIAALTWFFTGDLMRVVLVLVISCPCALVIATPSAAIAAIAAAARLGMLIKNVGHIETAADIRAIVFDKTGTLTEGNLSVARLNPVEDVELSNLLETACSAESQSNHPAASAMRKLAEEARVKWSAPDKFSEVPGKGVVATLDGDVCRVGRGTWLTEEGIDVTDLAQSIKDNSEFAGMSVVYVARGEELLGWIGLRDAVRPEAKTALERLEKLGVRSVSMVTGDMESVAHMVGRKIGIDDISAECLPEDKTAFVQKLKKSGTTVAVVGDGVNDAPALAAGDIGVAMGAVGSDVAINSASIALMNNDLRRIPALIALSRKTRLIMNVNLLFGAFMIVAGLMGFIFGDGGLNMIAGRMGLEPSVLKALLAAFVHIAGTLVIVFNSARLVRFGEDIDNAPAT